MREVLDRPDYHGQRRWGKSEKRYRSGKKHQRQRPESDWLWIEMPQWRIVPEELWQRVHARLEQNRTYALRLSKGRLAAGPPPIDLTTGRRPNQGAPHLLTGLARCVCGSGLEAFKRPWQDTHFYYCAANRRKGRSICPHHLKLPMTSADEDVLTAIKDCVFRPDIIKAVIERTVTQIERERAGDQVERLERELDDTTTGLARLASAIAAGGDIPALAAEAKKFEERRRKLESDLRGLKGRGQALDPDQVRRWIEERMKDWRGLLMRNREQGRQVLQRVLTDRLTFTLQPDGSCLFRGSATLGRILGSTGKAGATRGWWTRRDSNP